MSLARLHIEGGARERGKVQKKEPRVLCAGNSRQAVLSAILTLAILVLVLLRPHRSRAPWRLDAPPILACQEEGFGYQWLLLSVKRRAPAPGVSRVALALAV